MASMACLPSVAILSGSSDQVVTGAAWSNFRQLCTTSQWRVRLEALEYCQRVLRWAGQPFVIVSSLCSGGCVESAGEGPGSEEGGRDRNEQGVQPLALGVHLHAGVQQHGRQRRYADPALAPKPSRPGWWVLWPRVLTLKSLLASTANPQRGCLSGAWSHSDMVLMHAPLVADVTSVCRLVMFRVTCRTREVTGLHCQVLAVSAGNTGAPVNSRKGECLMLRRLGAAEGVGGRGGAAAGSLQHQQVAEHAGPRHHVPGRHAARRPPPRPLQRLPPHLPPAGAYTPDAETCTASAVHMLTSGRLSLVIKGGVSMLCSTH